jgi:hypothetical protein
MSSFVTSLEPAQIFETRASRQAVLAADLRRHHTHDFTVCQRLTRSAANCAHFSPTFKSPALRG